MKIIRRSLPLVALLACALSTERAGAQDAPAVAPGSRVRIYVSTRYNSAEVASLSRYHLGNVAAIDSSAVTLVEENGAEFRIPFSSIRQIDVSRGPARMAVSRRIGARKGAIIGAGATVGAFGLLYGITKAGDLLEPKNCPDVFPECEEGTDPPGEGLLEPSWENAGKLGLIGAVAGAVLGVAIGSAGREHWEGVPLRSLRRVQLAPAANGGTSISLRF